jgi:putative transposase
MQFIKGGFSFRLKSKMDVWMRSFNEVQIMSSEKYVACVRYIEENPVQERLVNSAGEYAFSSASYAALDAVPPHLRG